MMQPATLRSGASVALVVLAVIGAGFALRVLAGILVPFVLAAFLVLLIEAVGRLQRRHLPSWPRWSGTTLGVVAVASAYFGAIWIIGAQAAAVIGQASSIGDKLQGLVDRVSHSFGRSPFAIRQLFDDPRLEQLLGTVLQSLQGFLSASLLVAIYMGFMIASRERLRTKFEFLFAEGAARGNAVRIVEEVQRGSQEYVWVQTVTGLLIAGASWALMAALGQTNALLLALIVFLTSFIPVIGPFLGVALPPLFAIVQFDTLREPLILLVGLQAINFAVNNVMVPRMQSERLNLDPSLMLLSLALWSYLWGLTGALLSTPLTVLILAVTRQFRATHWLAILLSKDGRIDPTSKAGTAPHA